MGKWVYVDSEDTIDGKVLLQMKDGDSFVYVVSGDAMEPEYYDGDRVTIEHARELEFGDIGLFLYGSSYILREYGPGGLYAKNPRYPVMPAEGCQIIGKVCADEKDR